MYAKQKFLLNSRIKELQLEMSPKIFIAGGALTSVFSNSHISDIDFFFEDENTFYMFRNKCLAEIVIETPNAISYKVEHNGNILRFQFIKKIFGTPENIISQFDFTICMAAFIPQSQEIIMKDNFLYHLAERRLSFNISAKYPIASLWRTKKFLKKGFSLPAIESIKLALAINNLNIKNYLDLKKQLDGIDTLFLQELTDAMIERKDKEYDFKEAIEFMDNILAEKLDLEE